MSPLLLAWSNLTQQRFRTFVSVVGVGFAVLLVFMQLGFLDSVLRAATLVYDRLDFDLLITSREYISLATASTFSRDRLGQARKATGVESVLPMTAVLSEWRDPRLVEDDADAGRPRRSIMVLAVDPASLDRLLRRPGKTMFASEKEFAEGAAQLARLDTVLFDRTSRKEYGDMETWRRNPRNELNGKQVEVAGLIEIGTGFGYNGLVMTSEATLTRTSGWPAGQVAFGVVKLRPGANVEEVRADLSRRLGDEVEVYTREGIDYKEQAYWRDSTAVGQFFLAGVAIALVVGAVFVYQMMASDISRRLAEYATIRALGYRGRFLTRVVFWQGLFLALVGYVPGFVVALGCYELTRVGAGVPIGMTLPRAVAVFALTVVMCMGSSLLAVREAHQANPADLF